MDVTKALTYLESSFIKELINIPFITDISFNGKDFYYVTNNKGRNKSDLEIDLIQIKDFLRQIANLTEKQFSYQSPILDVSIGKYRLNAVHHSLARRNYNETLTFSIRIGGKKGLIDDDSGFLNKELMDLFSVLLKEKYSLVIGGITGSGKTELQKYLLNKLEDYTRIIIIDNVLELADFSENEKIDSNIWQADDRNITVSIQMLVRNALRSNPDWVIVGESRGAEMLEVLNSAMTGHPIITTIHAFDVQNMPSRLARMAMMSEKKMDYENVLQDIYYHFRFYIYLKKKNGKDGSIIRYVSDVMECLNSGEKISIYQYKNNHYHYHKLSDEVLSCLDEESLNLLPEVFKK